jgi:hypothetical protein
MMVITQEIKDQNMELLNASGDHISGFPERAPVTWEEVDINSEVTGRRAQWVGEISIKSATVSFFFFYL